MKWLTKQKGKLYLLNPLKRLHICTHTHLPKEPNRTKLHHKAYKISTPALVEQATWFSYLEEGINVCPSLALSHCSITIFSPGPLRCSELQTECRERAFLNYFVLALSVQFSMCPTTSFNAHCPVSIWKTVTAILMDTVFNHFTHTQKPWFQSMSVRSHYLILWFLIRHRELRRLHWCCLSSSRQQHQELQAVRAEMQPQINHSTQD